MSTIHNFIRHFTSVNIIEDQHLLKLKNAYYLVPDPLRRILLNTRQAPLHAGTLLGREYGNTFLPSTSLLKMLSLAAAKTITLNVKGAWLFICARDIMSESITNSAGDLEKSDLVIILNEHNEALGIGRVEQKISARGLVITNLYDIGWFARKKARGIPLR